ncbi:MAG: glucuronosyltransferase [Planctomycetes bacterium]|nr:glucuronosyltransferase [Planctomycetota bacterium]
MKRVVFITNHYLNADRKAGFHWLAEAFWRAGWHVLFFTESISWLSYLRGNERCKYPLFRERHRIHYLRERFASYVWMTPFHPINLRFDWLNRLAAPVLNWYSRFDLGEAEAEIARADLFVFDSDHGLLLFDRFKELNPRARFVYRVSDNLRMMSHHPILPAQEDRLLERFDLVSAPSQECLSRFPRLATLEVHHHGLEKELFDRATGNPYATPRPNVVYVGKNHFDADFLARAARLFPTWSFHVLGAVGPLSATGNVTGYGERPFHEIIPYLQHADIGLQNLTYAPGAEWFADSLKMYQYTYCRLPIVAPRFLKSDRRHVYYYEPGDDASIRAALLAANAHERANISTEGILSWDDLASKLAA